MVQVDNRGRVYNRTLQSFSLPVQDVSTVTFDSVRNSLMLEIETFISLANNWLPDTVDCLDMDISLYDSIQRAGRSCLKIDLPPKLKNKKAVINVHNSGKDCFKYALLSVLHYDDIPPNKKHLPQKYQQWLNQHNWDGITWPMTAGQLSTFEKINPDLRINLLEWREKDEEYPVHKIRPAPIPKSTERDVTCVSILSVEIEKDQWHYVGVTNIDRLLKCKTSNHTTFCERCLGPIHYKSDMSDREMKIDLHKKSCYADKPQSIKMPKNLDMQFSNYCKTQRLPYVLYADCECYLESDIPSCSKHIPIAIGLLLVPHPEMKNAPLKEPYTVFSGPGCMLDACKYIDKVARDVYAWNQKYSHVEMLLSLKEKQEFTSACVCYVCGEEFLEEGKKKVRDHDHLTGKYRGAACQDCNTKMRLKRNILPVFFHNARNYDNHLICQHALGDMKEWEVSVIPQTKERYISMSINFAVNKYFDTKKQCEKTVKMNIEIKDSAQFLLASLDSLVKNLDLDDMIYSRKCLPSNASTDHIKAKGFFPYEWFNKVEKMEYTSLPSRDEFYDKLNLKECSEADYQCALQAWEDFDCKTFADYMFAYLKRDVHQLADVFETFRKLAINEDGLDPAHYYTLPGLTLDSALKMSKVKLNLLPTEEMYCFVEKGIRGGCTFINKHHIKLNNEELDKESFRSNINNTEMFYCDANNLYGHALSEPLPTGNAEWMEAEMFEQFMNREWLLNQDFINSDFTYLIEADLSYPADIHDQTKDFPFAPEKLNVPSSMYSDEMLELLKNEVTNPKAISRHTKLMLTQFDKEEYVIHVRLLQFYVEQGMIITRINRILRFTQAPMMKEYIQYNSIKRQAAINDFEKDFYKLKNNALYGKTVENKRRRLNFKLANSPKKLLKYSSNPSFYSSVIFNENLVGCHLLKEMCVLDKPIFIGQAVLDIAKLIMYKLYYVKMKEYERKLNCKIEVVGSDTDSLFLEIKDCSVYEKLLPAMMEDDLLDTSNFPKDHQLYSIKNKARLGCVKDESGGEPYYEWILLKPKSYSLKSLVRKIEYKKAKGVKRATVAKVLNHDKYKCAYIQKKALYVKQRRISSKNHFLSTIDFTKKSLSAFENKRYWVNANYSLPFGHYSLNQTNISSSTPSVQTYPTHINIS